MALYTKLKTNLVLLLNLLKIILLESKGKVSRIPSHGFMKSELILANKKRLSFISVFFLFTTHYISLKGLVLMRLVIKPTTFSETTRTLLFALS